MIRPKIHRQGMTTNGSSFQGPEHKPQKYKNCQRYNRICANINILYKYSDLIYREQISNNEKFMGEAVK